mgnify:CR=1 FL=1
MYSKITSNKQAKAKKTKQAQQAKTAQKTQQKKKKQKKVWRYSGAKELLQQAIIDGTIADDAKPADVWKKVEKLPEFAEYQDKNNFVPRLKGVQDQIG